MSDEEQEEYSRKFHRRSMYDLIPNTKKTYYRKKVKKLKIYKIKNK